MDKIQLTKTFGVYQIKNLLDNKVYVGSTTKSFSTRWSAWRRDLDKGRGNKHLQGAWNRDGSDNFEFSVLEVVELKERVLEREQYWMDLYQSYDRTRGYNFAKEAKADKTGTKTNVEAIEAQRKRMLENPIKYWEGKQLPKEHKEKISQALKGKSKTSEHAANIGKAKVGNKNFQGKTHSEETRRDLSERMKETRLKPGFAEAHAESQRRRFARDGGTNKGKVFSEEHRANLSSSKKGQVAWNTGLRAKVCQRGHDLTDPANVKLDPKGRQQCKVCRRARDRRRKLNRKLMI